MRGTSARLCEESRPSRRSSILNTSSSQAQELQQLKDDFAFVNDAPCSIPLTKVKSLGITGRRQDVAAFAHGMLCQIAVHHSPQEVRILGIYPTSQKHDWEWLQQLPHTMPLRMGKQRRLVAEGQEEANQVLNILLEELSRRASKLEEKAPFCAPSLLLLP
jgi:DNA segregation ATPase FtsK/SpoIIIE, S-DNA-T family